MSAIDIAATTPEELGADSPARPTPQTQHVVGPTGGTMPVAEKRRGLGVFTAPELGYGALLFGSILAILFGMALLMATVVALCHKLFKLFIDDPLTAAAWGNGVGTTVMIVLVFVMVLATLLTMGERKWSALMQDRVGPNRARLPIPGLKDKALFGLPHIAADVLKMLTKEETVPEMGNKVLFHLAPAIAFAPAFVLFGVIPMSGPFEWMGETITMQVANIDQGLLYVFAIASVSVYGVTLAGWASNNKFALLGGIRAAAQMISYEVTLGLTLVGLMIVYGTLRLDVMSVAQGEHVWGWLPAWGVVFQPLAIFAYFAAASAEIKRAPFDLPEGESEVVGYFVEYSGLKFGIFMISEFVEVVVFAGLFATLFFGGYHLPWGEAWLAERVGAGWMGVIHVATFLTKTVFFCWLSLVVRWTFPRFRYDHIMDLGWKLLLPVSIVNVLLTGIVVLWGGTSLAAFWGILQAVFAGTWVIGALRLTRDGHETFLPSVKASLSTNASDAHH